jgi:AMP deaminase
VRKSSMSETDDHGSVSTSRRGKGGRVTMDGAVDEKEDSDGEMEEAGGMDE